MPTHTELPAVPSTRDLGPMYLSGFYKRVIATPCCVTTTIAMGLHANTFFYVPLNFRCTQTRICAPQLHLAEIANVHCLVMTLFRALHTPPQCSLHQYKQQNRSLRPIGSKIWRFHANELLYVAIQRLYQRVEVKYILACPT